MSINVHYKLCNNAILRSQCVRDLGVLLVCKLCFYKHTDCIFSQGLKMLGLIRYITSSSPTADNLYVSYTTLVRTKLESASVAWNSIYIDGFVRTIKSVKKICNLML
jgi:hypothetical protein